MPNNDIAESIKNLHSPNQNPSFVALGDIDIWPGTEYISTTAVSPRLIYVSRSSHNSDLDPCAGNILRKAQATASGLGITPYSEMSPTRFLDGSKRSHLVSRKQRQMRSESIQEMHIAKLNSRIELLERVLET